MKLSKKTIVVVIALIVVLIGSIGFGILVGKRIGGTTEEDAKSPQRLGIDDLQVNNDGWVINPPGKDMFKLPKEFHFRILPEKEFMGNSILLPAKFFSHRDQAIIEDPLPIADSMVDNGSGSKPDPNSPPVALGRSNERKLFFDIGGIRDADAVFGHLIKGQAIWLKLQDVIRGGMVGKTEKRYVSTYSWDSSDEGILVIKIRNPEECIILSNSDNVEDVYTERDYDGMWPVISGGQRQPSGGTGAIETANRILDELGIKTPSTGGSKYTRVPEVPQPEEIETSPFTELDSNDIPAEEPEAECFEAGSAAETEQQERLPTLEEMFPDSYITVTPEYTVDDK